MFPEAIVPLAKLVIKKELRERLPLGTAKLFKAVSLNEYRASAYCAYNSSLLAGLVYPVLI